jgi:hypothetical protein
VNPITDLCRAVLEQLADLYGRKALITELFDQMDTDEQHSIAHGLTVRAVLNESAKDELKRVK